MKSSVSATWVRGVVTVGSCATGARESGQVRKEAAFNGTIRVLQIAWPSPHCASGVSVADGDAAWLND